MIGYSLNNRLSKAQRLYSKKDIVWLLRSGRLWRCGQFDCCFSLTTLSFDRVAVLVGRRHGNAVQRNYIKRALRTIFRCSHQQTPHLDILIKPVFFNKFNVHEAAIFYSQWKLAYQEKNTNVV